MKSKAIIVILLLVVVIGYFVWKSKQKAPTPELYDGTLGEDISKGIAGYKVSQSSAEEDEVQELVEKYRTLTGYLPEEGLSLNTLSKLVESAQEKKDALDRLTAIKGQESMTLKDARALTTNDIERMVQDAAESQKDNWSARKAEINKLVNDTRSWLQAKHKDGAKINGKANNKSLYEGSVKAAIALTKDAEKIYFMDTLNSTKIRCNVYKYGDLTKIKEFSNIDAAMKELKSKIAKKFTDEVTIATSLQSLYKAWKNSGLKASDIDEFGTVKGKI